MKWETPKKKPYKEPKYCRKFDKWFAWYPVEVEGGITIWLDWVLYKYEWKFYTYKNKYGGESIGSYKKETYKEYK